MDPSNLPPSSLNTTDDTFNSSFSGISISFANEKQILGEKDPYNEQDYLKAFSSIILDQLNTQDMKALLESQQQIMQRLDHANKILVKTNQASSDTFNSFALKDFHSYIQILTRMKSDLDFIFKRIKFLKKKLENKYPLQYANAFKTVQQNNKALGMDDFEDEEEEFVAKETSLMKERTISIESSGSTGSKLSTSKSMFANFFETARSRISPTLNSSNNTNITLVNSQFEQIAECKQENNTSNNTQSE